MSKHTTKITPPNPKFPRPGDQTKAAMDGRDEPNPKALVDQNTAAKILQVQPTTLNCWRYTNRHAIPFYRIGSNIRYKVSDLLNFLESSRVDITSNTVEKNM